MENKKIIGATPVIFNDIHFKSKLEARLFKILQDEGLNPQYEPYKFHIWNGFKPSIPFYRKDKKTKCLKIDNTKIIDITYSPDIVVRYNKYTIFIEIKPDNFTNDVYPYKQKLFRKYMEDRLLELNPIFVRVGTIRNLREFINILKTEYNKNEIDEKS